jgi:hypothetical protein
MTIAMASYRIGNHWTCCDGCKGWFDPNEHAACTLWLDNVGYASETVCPNCASIEGLALCDGCGEYEYRDDLNECAEHLYCDDCADENDWRECSHCGDWVTRDEQYDAPDCETYCQDCYYERFDDCAGCRETFSRDELHYSEYDDSMRCDRCARDDGDFRPNGFRNRSGCTTRIGSERCYGVELETDCCDGYNELYDHPAWGAKDDCSVGGKELYSAILDGDAGLDAVADLANLASCNDWDVDDRCGYHLHLDMRAESDDSLFAAAYAYRATQSVWFGLVDESRHDGCYSHSASWDCDEVGDYAGDFNSFVRNRVRGRYDWVNLSAYNKFTTFEVRLHQGTVDENEVCNWIKAHTRFVDWACSAGLAGVKEALDGKDSYELFDFIANEVWRDEKLSSYYCDRVNLYS